VSSGGTPRYAPVRLDLDQRSCPVHPWLRAEDGRSAVSTFGFPCRQNPSLHVPGDLSVIGFDDLELSGVVTPSLTTVRQPLEEMARLGVQFLLRLIGGREIDTLHVELVPRASTAPPR
jgi:hypothetical protein